MIRQHIYIQEYDWFVKCYYAVDTYYTDEIASELVRMGADGAYLMRAVENMESGNLNNGLCYSNMREGESVLVVSLTSSAAEFMNSLTHELHHLTMHICEARGVDPKSEDAAYIDGDMAMAVFPRVVSLLCEHCRNEKRHRHID